VLVGRQTGSAPSVKDRYRVEDVAFSAGLTVDPQKRDNFGRKTLKEAARSNQIYKKIVQLISLPRAGTMKMMETVGTMVGCPLRSTLGCPLASRPLGRISMRETIHLRQLDKMPTL
jgi:hypothetical protein